MEKTQQTDQKDTKDIENVRVLIVGSGNEKTIDIHLKNKGFISQFFELEEPLKDVATNFSLKDLKQAIAFADKKDIDLIFGVDQSSNKLCVAVKNYRNKFQLLSPHQLAAIMVNQRKKDSSENSLLIAKSIHISEMIDKMLYNVEVNRMDFLIDAGTLESKVKELSKQHSNIDVLAFTENQEIIDSRNDVNKLIQEIILLEGHLKEEGKSLFDLMVRLYKEYGFYKEKTFVLDYNQSSQKEHMVHVMEEIRKKPSSILESLIITHVIDYKKGISVNLLTKKLLPVNFPSYNILQIKLADGTSVTFAPQADKIYFYISIKGTNFSNEDFEENDKYLNERILKVVQLINKL